MDVFNHPSLTCSTQFPVGQIRLKGTQVEEQKSKNMDINSGQSADSTIIIQALNQSPAHLQVDSQHEKVNKQY